MALNVETIASQCPDSKIVMSGYRYVCSSTCFLNHRDSNTCPSSCSTSQGAQIVHNAVAKLPNSVASRVTAVVMFGDPDMGEPLGKGLDEKTKAFCATGDLICKHEPVILPAHWTYGIVSLLFANVLCLPSPR